MVKALNADNPLIVWFSKRIKANKNALIVVNGPTGSGKSYSCLTLANLLSKKLESNFSLEDNLSFNFVDLLKKMQLPQNSKPGTVFIFEETGSVGSGSASRQWQSKANAFFYSFMQTSRHRNQIIFMNCPNFSALERGARSLCHMQLESIGIDPFQKVVMMKPYKIQVNSRTGKFYFKYLRFTQNGNKFRLTRVNIPHPGEELAKKYEKMKLQFTTQLNNTIIKAESGEETTPKIDKVPNRKIDPIKAEEMVRNGEKIATIARYFNCSTRAVDHFIDKMKRNKTPWGGFDERRNILGASLTQPLGDNQDQTSDKNEEYLL